MSRLTWDKVAEHTYETGVDRAVLYPMGKSGKYEAGVAWNGITGITHTPSGADANDFYADNIKYLTLRGAENVGGTINAYTCPNEWYACDGSAELLPGIYVGQQTRKAFGLCYRTLKGNDTEGTDYGYILHLVYNATASPSSREYSTVNESPEPLNPSWEFSTTSTSVKGQKPASYLTIDSTVVDAAKLKLLEDKLYGTDDSEPTLLTIDEVIELFQAA